MANISPWKYSLLNSANRSISRYCSGVRNVWKSDDIVLPSPKLAWAGPIPPRPMPFLRRAIRFGLTAADRRLSRRQTRDGHPIGRARHVVHTHPVAELHRTGLAA